MGLEYDDVLEILELLEHSDVEYLEIEVGGTRLVASSSGLFETGPVASHLSDARSSTQSVRAAAATTSVGGTSPPEQAPSEQSPSEQARPKKDVRSAEPSASSAPTGSGEQVRATDRELAVVRAPMVGVFYRRPDPGSPPFVEVGTRVSDGDTLGLLEVMKMFTGVTAPVAGEIAEVLVEDGDFVEYDQPLVRIRPDRL